MPAQIKDLARELDALQSQISVIDLDTIQVQIDQAKADLTACKSTLTLHHSQEEVSLRQELSRLENLLSSEKSKLRNLTRQIQPLALMLSAPAKLQAAKDDLSVLHSRAAEANTQVASAEATTRALAGLLADAEAHYAGQLEYAAKEVLSAAKQGIAIASTPIDRGHVDSLQAALAMAETELATAETELAESLTAVQSSEREVTQATIDAAGLRFELQTRDFVDAVCAFESLGGVFDAGDLSDRCAVAQQNAAGLREMWAEENAEH
ncbi:MAG: hypothetical protein IPN53_18375 [Comamonadaceae bacterium]|nr:hypothetical protein [Comamonadaceae bacterium]